MHVRGVDERLSAQSIDGLPREAAVGVCELTILVLVGRARREVRGIYDSESWLLSALVMS